MEHAIDHAAAARAHLAAHGWIPRKAELFRHLPPPPAEVWLGEEPVTGAAVPASGWSVLELPVDGPGGTVGVRWFDAGNPVQRASVFSGLPAPGEDEAAPFAWAHRALVRHALRLRVDRAAADAPPTLLHVEHRPGAAVEAPLLVLELQPGARCVLLESHPRDRAAGLVQNLQVHVRLAQGASLQHLRVALGAPGDRLAHHVHVRLQRDATYAQCLLASTGDYHLQRNLLELQGEGAAAHVAGVLLGATGALEQQVLARHAAARSRSNAEVLALPGAAARMVASAHTRIAAGSDEAQARQRLRGIPMAGQPRIVLRPHLEIHHDQVQAAHGATWGSLPEEALFHARQRGLDEATAKGLILGGLARSVLDAAIDDSPLPAALRLEPLLEAALARELGVSHG
ncbi:MAG TPA: SufD family Fe-S cluster assembly protein [Ramlibacter sp.]